MIAPRRRNPATVPRFVIRQARASDLPALLRLARILDSINLPTDRAALRETIARSTRSFAGKIRDRAEAIYVFATEDRARGRAVGSSLIIAKHGTPESPHYFLEMVNDERYSKTLGRMFRHTYLRLRHSMDGPTEVGGLVVEPRLRRHPERIGTQLSCVRFLYMALHRARFGSEVIAEMKPPLTPRGESLFWECYGARVTGLTFHDADRLSTRDKEFIEALFPDAPIYTCMLPVAVQERIGKVGADTVGAVKILDKLGLRFLGQVDPFDAGPYYGAPIDQVTLSRDLRRVRLMPDARESAAREARDFLVAVERRGFLAFRAAGRIVEDLLFVEPELLAGLGLRRDLPAAAVPLG